MDPLATFFVVLLPVVLLGGFSGLTLRRLRRERAASRDREGDLAERFERQLATARAELDRSADRHRLEVNAAQGRFETQLAHERDATAAQERQVASLLALHRRAIRWEEASLRDIIDLLNSARIDALVASNVVFTHDDGTSAFVAQIDHVVVARRAVVVIESKRWQGAVFDGVEPGATSPALAALFRTDTLAGAFAVHLKRESHDRISVRIEGTQPAESSAGAKRKATTWRPPREQARRQAARLQNAFQRRGLAVPWVSSIVYYSHPEGILVASPGKRDGGSDPTSAVGSVTELTRCLRRELNTPAAREQIDVQAVGEVLSEWGADVRGTAGFADRWPSPV